MRAIIIATIFAVTMGLAMANAIEKTEAKCFKFESEQGCQSEEEIHNEDGVLSPEYYSEEFHSPEIHSPEYYSEEFSSEHDVQSPDVVCIITSITKLVDCFKGGFNDKTITCVIDSFKGLFGCFKKEERSIGLFNKDFWEKVFKDAIKNYQN